MLAEHLDLLLFAAVCLAILAGFPVAFTLAGVSLLFALLGDALGVFNMALLGALPQRVYGIMGNSILIAVPLFIFMGVLLERSRIAQDLLDTMALLFGGMRAGLGLAVCLVGALMAASTGIVGATVVTMGLLSLPSMLRHGWPPALASGTISAAGTLGQIIPPSIVLILLGDVIATAYQQAQTAQGVFNVKTVSVGELFAGALIPGLLLVGLYMGYLVLRIRLQPSKAPTLARDLQDAPADRRALARQVAVALVPPLVLIVAVLGSILGGVATPTEASSVGAVGALLLAGYHQDRARPWPILAAAGGFAALLVLTALLDLRLYYALESAGHMAGVALAFGACGAALYGIAVALWRCQRNRVLGPSVYSSAQLTALVFVILIGATVFALVFRGLGGDETVRAILENLPGGLPAAMLLVMAMTFVLGFFLDFIEITLVVVPLVAPPLIIMGADPIWLAIMFAVNLQTSFLTPPFGFALFYLRGVAPARVPTSAIYTGALPFVLLQLGMLGLLALVPELATWLPEQLY